MLKVVFAILTGLVGAALLHLIIILALPHFTGLDAYTGALAMGDSNRFYRVGQQADDSGLADGDPFLRASVCSFDVGDQPVRLLAGADVPFWSLAVYDSSSNEVFSMNDRTSVGGVADVVVAAPEDLTALRKSLPEGLAQSILVEMPRAEGYAVLRALVPRQSLDDAAQAFLAGATCDSFALPAPSLPAQGTLPVQ